MHSIHSMHSFVNPPLILSASPLLYHPINHAKHIAENPLGGYGFICRKGETVLQINLSGRTKLSGGGDNSVRIADNSVRDADNSVTQENKDKENKDKEKAYTPKEVVKYRYKPTCHGKPFCPKCGQSGCEKTPPLHYQYQPRREQKLPIEADMSGKCPRNAAVLAVSGYKKP